MTQLYLVWRYLNSGGRFLNLTSILAIIGMAIGVAALVVSMSVVSGYESTLKKVVTDVVGHLLVAKRGGGFDLEKDIGTDVKPLVDGFTDYTPYLVLEAIMAGNKKISGVIVEGIDPESFDKVLNIRERLLKGQFDLTSTESIPHALIGKEIAKKFDVSVGQTINLVIPLNVNTHGESFRPKKQRFYVAGILGLGRHDYDERYILTSLTAAQDFIGRAQEITGVRVRMHNPEKADATARRINSMPDSNYWARSWRGANRNLFDAVKYEKPTIFFVLLIIVIAACFNISSTLFVSVLRRYRDISVLKTIGANNKFLVRLFTIQGLVIGAIGSLLGILLGVGLCYAFLWAQQEFNFIPAEVYKLDHLEVELRLADLLAIFSVSMIVCYLSTLAPARRGAKLKPVEGLRYE